MSRSSTGPELRAARQASPSSNAALRDGTVSVDVGQGSGSDFHSMPAFEAPALDHFQDVLGNDLILDSLSGADLGGLGPLVAGEVVSSVAGVETGGFDTSNMAMARAFRDSIDQDGVRALNSLHMGGGMSLPALQRERMERAFDHDFGHVRIHTDAKAQVAAQAIHAHAFAIGSNIFFGRGTWAPGSTGGDRLLAHELTHVVQHDEGRIPTRGSDQDSVSSPSDPLEREAYGNEVAILGKLHQVDADIRSGVDTDSAALEAEVDRAVALAGPTSSEAGVDFGEPEQALVGHELDQDLTSDSVSVEPTQAPAEGLYDTSGLDESVSMDLELDLGGFAAGVPGDGAGAADAGDGAEGLALREAVAPTATDKASAQDLIRQSRGSRIDAGLAARLGTVLGHDVSHATVHTDAAAAQAADALSARAFALGSDIFFADGAFQPGTSAGDALIAHELTHVVQHDEGRISARSDLEVSRPEDSLEREAEQVADTVSQASQENAWTPMGVPEAVQSRISLAMGLQDADYGVVAPIDDVGLDAVATDLGARAFTEPGAALSVPNVGGPDVGTGDSGLALREAAPATAGSDIPAPEDVTFNIAGLEMVLDLREYLSELPKDVEIPIDKEPLPGLKITKAELKFNDDGDLDEGSLKAELKIGDFETVGMEGGLELKVDEQYNVSLEGQELQLKVGEAFEATANVTLTSESLTAEVTARLTQAVNMGGPVSLESVEMTGTYESSTLVLDGDIALKFGDWAEGTLTAHYEVTTSEDGVDGDLDMRSDESIQAGSEPAPDGEQTQTPSAPQEAGPGSEGPASGDDQEVEPAAVEGPSGQDQEEDSGEESSVPAPMPLTVPGSGKWNATGTLMQTKELVKGDVTIHDAKLTADIQANVLQIVGAEAQFTAPHIEGSVKGQLDVPSESVHGTGEITLTEEIRLEELGVTIDELDAKATVEANALKNVTGRVHAVVDYEEQPTFDVSGEELQIDFAQGGGEQGAGGGEGGGEGGEGGGAASFSGQVTMKTLRDLTFGNEKATHATITEGANAQATVAESQLKSMDGGLDYKVTDPTSTFGEGTVTLTWGAEGGLGGEGTFKLIDRYGLPERETGPLYLEEGGSFKVTMAEDALQDATVETVDFTYERPEDQGTGEVKGSVSGSYAFETGKADVKGDASLTEEWPYETSWGTFTLDKGGEVNVEVTNSELTTMHLNVPYKAEVTKGQEFSVEGKVEGDIDAEGTFTGTLDGELQDDIEIEVGKGGDKLRILQAAKVEGQVDKNNLEQLDVDFRVQYYDAESELFFEGNVEDGTYVLGEDANKLSFNADLSLMKEVAKSAEGSDLEAKVLAGAGLEVDVKDNALERVGGQLKFQVYEAEELLLDGSVKDMELDVKNDMDISGSVDVKTGKNLDIPRDAAGGGDKDASGFILRAKAGSGADGRIEKSALAELNANLELEVHEGADNLLAEGKVSGSWDVTEDKVKGSGDVKLVRDFALTEAPAGDGPMDGWNINLRKGSSLTAQVEDNALQEATVEVDVDFKKNDEKVAKGNLNGAYRLGQEEGYTGGASVELIEEIELGEDSRFGYHMTPPTKIEANVAEGGLKSASGEFNIKAREAETDKIAVKADGSWEQGKGVSGSGGITVIEDLEVASKGDHTLTLEKDSGGEATVDKDVVTDVHGTLKLRLDEGGSPKVRAVAEASYKLSEGADADISAKGSMELLDDVTGLESEEYELRVLKGTKAEGEIADGDLKYIEGEIKADVKDSQSPFVEITAQGRYDKTEEGGNVDVSGKATVVRKKEIVEEPVKVAILENSTGEATVEDNDLTRLGGKLDVQVDDKEGPFVKGELKGEWTKEGGTNAWAEGTLLRELQMGDKVGDYTFFVEKDGKASAHVEADELTEVGGDLGVRIDDEGGPFLRGTLTGNYKLKGGEGFTGKGTLSVLRAKQLGSIGSESLWVEPSTGAQLDITNNNIDKFAGDVKLTLRDKSPYVEVAFGGSYDTGKKAFTGEGGATVVRDKQLFGSEGGYSFWLKASDAAGAHAKIDENKLTEVSGNVPFMVKDGNPEPLLEGAAEGKYDPESGKFSGSGEVYLGRDVEYALGSGKLLFLKGSGGDGTVVDSELRELGGTLKVEIHDAEGKLIALEAAGRYDAVKNEIIEVEGSASLEREYKPLDSDLIVIEKIEGSARVERNELKWAKGSGAFRVALPDEQNPMRGTLTGEYRNEGGKESYTGKGTLDFTLFSDPSKGREMKGSIDAEVQDGGKFKVKGDVDYKMSDLVEGKVGVEMDQEMDPVINASLEVNKELVPGQDLFQLNMPLIPHTTIPIYGPIALAFGAKAGMGMSTRALQAGATIGISNWRPVSEESQVPDFEAALRLDWGMDFDALLAAYLSLELTAGIGSAGAGIRGEVGINAAIPFFVEGKLMGGKEGFFGELNVGTKIEPEVVLRAVPFVYAQLTGFGMIQHDFDALESNMGPMFSFEWGTSYTFGDENRRQPRAPTGGEAPAVAESQVEHSQEPEIPAESVSTPQASPGGPELESGSEIAGSSGQDRAQSGGGGLSDLMQKVEDVKVLAEGLGAVGYLVELLVDLVTALMVAGPAGLVIMLAWKIVKGDLSWDGLVEAVTKVVDAVAKAAEMLRPHLPTWLNNVIDFFSGDKPSLIDAFFGADDKVREEVRKGTYREFPNDGTGAEMIAGFIDEMASGYCGGADEECILELLDFATSRGQLSSVLSMVDGGADHLDYKIDGGNSRRFRRLMDSNGIQYKKSWF